MRKRLFSRWSSAIVCSIVLVGQAGSDGRAQQPDTRFVAPPRTIADVTALLDQERPDPAKIGKLRADADAVIPPSLPPERLFAAYEQRALARSHLGRTREAISDFERAAAAGKEKIEPGVFARVRMSLIQRYKQVGDYKRSLDQCLLLAREVDRPGSKGWLFSTYRVTSEALLALGDISQAETYIRRSEALLAQARSWDGFPNHGVNWESNLHMAKALIYETKGQFREAEAAYRAAEVRKRSHIATASRVASVAARTSDLIEQNEGADGLLARQGRMKALQGRLAEAEVDVRRALLSRLNAVGKHNPASAWFIEHLVAVLAEQGRYPEAESLLRASLQIKRDLGMPEESTQIASSLNQLGRLLAVQARNKEAAQAYAELDAAIKNLPAKMREGFELNNSRVYQAYGAGQFEAGLKLAEALLARNRARFGEKHANTVFARGVLAVGYSRAGNDELARREFKEVIPLVLNDLRLDEGDSDVAAADRRRGRETIAEAYFATVARTQPGPQEINETFQLADLVRSQSVHRALAASSARLLARDTRLAEQVRKEQDLAKQIGAQTGLLNNVLALPSVERDEKATRELTAQITALRNEHAALRKSLQQSFPGYADLVDAKPPAIDDIRKVLRPDEALLSFYLGRRSAFVWVVRKDGDVGFATLDATNNVVERLVRGVREGLETSVETLDKLPPFELDIAHELYQRLLKSTEDKWQPASNLIIVTNGALGQLPLAVLPTAKATVSLLSANAVFAEYRTVPWLGRTHAITSMPSASALRTLRLLPSGRRAGELFVGFGDPLFNKEQADTAEAPDPRLTAVAGLTERGGLRRRAAPQTMGVDSADLALLPRLPDTADELHSIAQALKSDPAKVLHLRKDANEQIIKQMDLTRFRVVAFATHGLVPGELNGLTQPALALTAPEVAGVNGDGLLTMEEVLALKLNADWVVLSACNTATGASAGAEAVTGLGRAFFYAGARTLLLTNWSVYSVPAAMLVTDIFRRQAGDPDLTRAQALRQAMLALMDGPGFVDPAGKAEVSYAHPVFWAPYTIAGDGGTP